MWPLSAANVLSPCSLRGLKQESSQSVSASADIYQRFGNVQTNLLIEGFFTDLTDVFALRQLDEPDAAGKRRALSDTTAPAPVYLA